MLNKEQIVYMQTRLVRYACEQWGCSKEEVVTLFQKYNIFEYIQENYEYFHIEGDEAILEDIKQLLEHKGGNICGET